MEVHKEVNRSMTYGIRNSFPVTLRHFVYNSFLHYRHFNFDCSALVTCNQTDVGQMHKTLKRVSWNKTVINQSINQYSFIKA